MIVGTLFLAAIASALIPVINMEAILVIAVAREPGLIVPLVVAATVGQMIGKLLWYWGGMHVDRAPWVRRHLDKPKVRAALDRWHARAEGRPVFTAGLLLLSGSVGLPPYAVTAVLAGVLRVPWSIFLVTGLVGRGIRFAAIAAGMAHLVKLW